MLYFIFYTTLFIVGVRAPPYHQSNAQGICAFDNFAHGPLYDMDSLKSRLAHFVDRRLLGDKIILDCRCKPKRPGTDHITADNTFFLLKEFNQKQDISDTFTETEKAQLSITSGGGGTVIKTLTVESGDNRFGNDSQNQLHLCCMANKVSTCTDGTGFAVQMKGLKENEEDPRPLGKEDIILNCETDLYESYELDPPSIQYIYRVPPRNPVFFKWIFNGQKLEESEKFSITGHEYNGSTLTIRNPTSDDGGDYHCHMYMEEDSEMTNAQRRPMTFNLAGPPLPTTENHDNNPVVASFNENLTLDCDIGGYPKPIITWYKNHSQVADGTLTFTPFQKTNEGNYSCSGINPAGVASPSNVSYIILGRVAPELNATQTSNSEKIGFDSGINMTWHCPIVGVPPPKVKWYKESVELPGHDRRFHVDSYNGMENATLYLTNMVESDAGHYTCVATNDVNQDFTVYRILIMFARPKPTIKNHDNNPVYATFNENLTLDCDIGGYPKPNITWYKDNVRFADGTLTFTRFQKTHEGTYSCSGINADGVASLSNVSYIILGKFAPRLVPTQTSNYRTTGFRSGMTMTWHCPIDGVPPPKVKWYKESVELPGNDQRFHVRSSNGMENATLYLTNLVELDAGNYTCVGTNDINQHVTFHTTLRMYVSPFLTSKTNSTHSVYNAGEYETFACPVDGLPKPDVTWFKNPWSPQIENYTDVIVQLHADNERIFIQNIDGILGGLLNFTNFTLADSGKYYCHAANGNPPNVTYEIGLREGSLVVYPDFKRKMPQSLFGVYAIGVTAYTIISIWAANFFYNRRFPQDGLEEDDDD